MPGRSPLIVLALFLVLAACAHQGVVAPPKQDIQALYDQGKSALRKKNYQLAVERFQALSIYYPGTPLAIQSQLELAYSYYKDGDFISSIATANRFIADHTGNAHLDYLYYLRGLAAYQQTIDFLTAQPHAEVLRQPPWADLSLQYFNALRQRFPASKYSEDARQRMALLRTRLAKHGLQLAKHALEEKRYATATLHARAVSEGHPPPPIAGEAATVASMASRMLKLAASTDNHQAPLAARLQTIPTTGTLPAPLAAPTVTPPTLTSTAPIASTLPHREAWLLQQPANHYTLQLLGTRSEQALRTVIHRYHLAAHAAYFLSKRSGAPWFTLLYGNYPNAVAARKAVANLPEKLRSPRPWVRRFGGLQSIIRAGGK